jgi:tRNA threonylcarbamoyladenosine biosynthesis protein TsaB
MKLLCIETATEACSAALYIDGEVRHTSQLAPRRHAELILGMCGQLLDEAGLATTELDGIGFGRGPGAFTGVRIATGVAQGLAWASDLPVVPVSSLAALAQGAYRQHLARYCLAAIDARMNEVYAGAFVINEDGIATIIGEERVCAPDKLVLPGVGDNWFGSGSGWQTHEAPLHALCAAWLDGYVADSYPDAYDVAVLAAHAFEAGQYVDAAHALPVYLRDNVAAKKAR